MSFVWNKFFFSSLHSGRGRVLFFFSFFWLIAAIFLVCHSLILKQQIQQQQLARVASALHTYLEHNRDFGGSRLSLGKGLPDELDFIRLVRGNDQLLVTGSSHMDFSGLVDLPPTREGTWIDLRHPQQSGDWLLVSETLESGGVAQAGKNDSATGRSLHRKSVTGARWLFLCSALPALGLALLCNALMRRPLQELQQDIEKALEQKGFIPAADRGKKSDLRPLYHLLEQIFQQNRQLIREMQSSLDNVAHDLRTPMTRLRAVAEYALQSDSKEPQLYCAALSDCLEESERVLSILGVMMSVAEAEAGTMRLELQEVDVAGTLEDVVGLYQYVAEEERISVSCTVESGLLIRADKTRISQVWANLFDNAIKYGHESGQVSISAEGCRDEAVIRFCDDGMGISPGEIEQIWDRLYRGDRSRTKQGLGLGLNYVKAVIESHGGRISVTSSIGEGSCFEVRLPLLQQTLPTG